MRVAFTGGGTGGHIYPALAIDGALRALALRDGTAYEARFFGNAGGLERDLVPPEIPLEFVPSRPLSRKLSLELLKTAGTNAAGVGVALQKLAQYKPDIVIATGGYVCAPVVAAARLLRTATRARMPIVFVEINAVAGLTTRLLLPMVDEVWGAYDASRPAFGPKFVATGAPVRPSLLSLPNANEARAQLGLEAGRTTIAFMGGSQGARSINEAVAALVTRRTLPGDWQILHICGRRDYAYMRAEEREVAAGNVVRLVEYLADPAPAYAAADLVVARAGASTLAELAATGTPSLLIPFPFAAEDHQRRNAEVFVRAGAARLMDDAEVNGDALWWRLRELTEPGTLGPMRAAAHRLAPGDVLERIVARCSHLVRAEGKATAR